MDWLDGVNLTLAVFPLGVACLYFFWRLSSQVDELGRAVRSLEETLSEARQSGTKEHAELMDASRAAQATTIEEHREMTRALTGINTNIAELNKLVSILAEKVQAHADEERMRALKDDRK